MSRWLAGLLILVLMVVIGGLALRERPLPAADFTYAIGDSIKTLDPAKMSWNEDIRMALGVWEGLACYDPVTVEALAGAAYWPEVSKDGLTYRFRIREAARWSNGEALLAEDFVFGWRRAIEPGTAEDYAFLITENIAGAAEYSRFRHKAVRVLTLLRDLGRGRGIEEADEVFLREEGLWEDGAEKARWAELASGYREKHLAAMAGEFSKVGLKVLGEKELEVRLARPISYFMDLAAFSTFLPIHRSIELLREVDDPAVKDLTLWVYDPQWVKPDYHRNGYPGLVTNGAFRMADWQFKRYMLFERNEYYWDRAQVRSGRIMARIMPEANTAFLAYERGEVDFLDDVTRLDFAPTLVSKMKAGKREDIHLSAAFGTYFYNFNCLERLGDGSLNPFFDKRVRRAFNLAVDKQAIVETVKKVGNPVARHFIPPGSIAGYVCDEGPGYDPSAAKALLAEAGYSDGSELGTVEILYNSGYGHEMPAQAIAEMWRKHLGIQVSLRGKELKSFAEDKQNQRFMICRASWFGDYGDPTTFLDMLISGNGNNDSAYSDERYDGLMARASGCLDREKRFGLLAEAERLVMTDGFPILPIYHYVSLLAFREEVKGLYPNARNMYPLKWIYVEDSRGNKE